MRLGLGGFLLELLLPVAIAGALLWVVATRVPFWNLHTQAGLWVFGALLVVLSLGLSIRIDLFTLAGRRKTGKRRLLNRADARSRLVKFILAGVVVPIAFFVGANRLDLGNHRTPMSLALEWRTADPEATHARLLGDAVLHAGEAGAKAQGILALQEAKSGAALDQLFRILDGDPAVLREGAAYEALSKGVAAYGSQAVPGLLQRFERAGAGDRKAAAAPPGDVFERYFSPGFAGLQAQIEARNEAPVERAARLERLRAAEAQLKATLAAVDAGGDPGGGSVASFVLETFLRMGTEKDPTLLSFARRTAADASWSNAVRGRALLLVAKLGASDDLAGLYAYLESPDAGVRAYAMRAIAVLQAKATAAGGG